MEKTILSKQAHFDKSNKQWQAKTRDGHLGEFEGTHMQFTAFLPTTKDVYFVIEDVTIH